jgi:hypothetical protein
MPKRSEKMPNNVKIKNEIYELFFNIFDKIKNAFA